MSMSFIRGMGRTAFSFPVYQILRHPGSIRSLSSPTSSEEIALKLDELQQRMFKMENTRSGDFYKYGFTAFGACVAAAFGAGYINKRIDDTKSELKEKISDLDTHIEKRIDVMERNIVERINISQRVSKLEEK